MKFLWITPTLDPINGGAVVATTQLISALTKLDHQCEVVTLSTESSSIEAEHPWKVHALGPSLGKYGYNKCLVPWLIENAKRYDAVIVSGIWQYQSLATWFASQKNYFPYFVFIHGALAPWFKYTYPIKHIKKWLYWPWAEYRVLRDATGVLFTSEEERKAASKSFWLYKANEVVINNGIVSPQGNPDSQREIFLDKFPHLKGKSFLLFLGRIHPVKGCDMLIDAFAQIVKKYPNFQLVMAGPGGEGISLSLMKQASQLGVDKSITWTGMLSGDLKWGAYRTADVFILPSHSENFGVVVAEALACSLPVLITDKVNIWREIENDNAGIVDVDTKDGVVRLLQNWLVLTKNEKEKMRENALHSFESHFDINRVSNQFAKTIIELTKKSPAQ